MPRTSTKGTSCSHGLPPESDTAPIAKKLLMSKLFTECYLESFEPPKPKTVSNPAKGVKVKVQVMQRVKRRRVDLIGEIEMPQIGSRERPARVALARRIHRSVVFRVARVLDVDAAVAREELAVPRVS